MYKRDKELTRQGTDDKGILVGKRGVGLNRAQRYGFGFNEYKKWVEDSIVIIAQIEHIEGVHYFTRGKVVTSRWLDPSHGGINLGFPQNS